MRRKLLQSSAAALAGLARTQQPRRRRPSASRQARSTFWRCRKAAGQLPAAGKRGVETICYPSTTPGTKTLMLRRGRIDDWTEKTVGVERKTGPRKRGGKTTSVACGRQTSLAAPVPGKSRCRITEADLRYGFSRRQYAKIHPQYAALGEPCPHSKASFHPSGENHEPFFANTFLTLTITPLGLRTDRGRQVYTDEVTRKPNWQIRFTERE